MKKWINKLLNGIFFIMSLALLWGIGQIFFFASFRIPSDSMEPTLEAGDYVLVWKPVIGARLFNLNATLQLKQTNIYRMPGLRKIKRNDVLVFNFPYPNNWNKMEMHILKYYIKRCIGLPGDTLSIRNGRYHVNGVNMLLGNKESQTIIGITRSGDFPQGVYKSFPHDSILNWNIQNFGPLYIPKEGDEICLNRTNYILYRNLIEWEQNGKLDCLNGQVTLNGKPISTYRFRKNYYFMGGDKGENSQDSRYWGLLPEEYIVGKAVRIWKSKDRSSGEIRWNRVWKKIE